MAEIAGHALRYANIQDKYGIQNHYENKPILKILSLKKWKVSDKNSDIFSYFCSPTISYHISKT